ncbi:DNA/RNA non-specific endonuclease (plasmid) [Rhodoferax ferrireducens T118]|uniref:Endonuclease n=1 Tax=Albidiferax ferrireducens (strain ATCC BAA-621 / DSM 15236 / T118) TaxID=338969 RepID=Q21QE0_ALBFT|nr:DNA/RNA non-specific endonuclease [Rhodoferax ferrireducens]ABD72005.1 DNA/RNA non-specific endonuclease [Rhodoferax ferrireducens T118]
MKNPWASPQRKNRPSLLLSLGLSLVLAVPSANAGFITRTLTRVAAAAAITSVAHAYAKNKRSSDREADAPRGQTTGDRASCTDQLPMGKAPTFSNPKLGENTHQVCYQEYTVLVSGKTLTPLWSAEYMTKQRVLAARRMKRVNSFHEEDSVPIAARARLADFVGAKNIDRGHLAPSGDMTSPGAQYESFSLGNMIAQNSSNNRHVWEGIESGTRNFAVSNGKVYVITGPLFIGQNIRFMNNRVAIPTQIFKLLYNPVNQTGGVYVVDNVDTETIGWKSIAQFEQFSGYRFNLGAPALMAMPQPQQHFERSKYAKN